MLECRIDFNVDDSELSIEQMLVRIRPAYEALAREEPSRINLTSCQYLGPPATVLLVGLARMAIQSGVSIDFIAPKGPEKLLAYCRFSGLDQELFGGCAPNASHPESVTIPVACFSTVNYGVTNSVLALVSRFLDMDDDSQHALTTCVFETLNNIRDHAESPVGSILSARYQRQRNRVHIAVLDHGMTIPRCVRAAGVPIESDEKALRWASIAGNTSKPKGTNLGEGLDTLRLLVKNTHGSLNIFSGKVGLFQRGEGRPSVRRIRAELPGTLVSFYLGMRDAEVASGIEGV